MNKKGVIILFSILSVFFIILLVLYNKPRKAEPESNPAKTKNDEFLEFDYSQNKAPDKPSKSEFLVDVVIPDGETVKISGLELPNFYKFGSEPGLLGETTIINRGKYRIVYYPADEGFLIPILGRPFEEYREKAEQEFLEVLSVDEQDACKMKVSITTPFSYNPEYAGVNWKLSWCK